MKARPSRPLTPEPSRRYRQQADRDKPRKAGIPTSAALDFFVSALIDIRNERVRIRCKRALPLH
jgi:hypothetical protein